MAEKGLWACSNQVGHGAGAEEEDPFKKGAHLRTGQMEPVGPRSDQSAQLAPLRASPFCNEFMNLTSYKRKQEKERTHTVPKQTSKSSLGAET